MPEHLYFSVLGPLEITRDGRAVPLVGAQRRALLATLLLRANRPVTISDLADRLWNHQYSADARRTIQVYVVRLRQVLGDVDLIGTDPMGYSIRIDPDHLDLMRFTALVRDATQSPDVGKRAELLTEALALWRGPACADIDSDVLQAVDVRPLHEQRLDAEEQFVDAELTLGRHTALLPRLRELVAENPLRERFAAQLMVSLYRSGRQAEAVDAYRTAATALADELGLDPGPELRHLHQAILTADPQLLNQPTLTQPATTPIPAQLPADSASFTGRASELDELLGLPELGDDAPTAVLISAIDGMAGIGKTALAVHAAHRLAADFPDGQLFIDLRGYTEGVQPVEPADALDRMLRALGVPGEHIPAGLEDRAGLYRSTLAGRRMLILLDNAIDASQVRPLLPGQPGCLVLITSRRRLTDLDSVHRLTLDLLPLPDAVALFARISGAHPLGDAHVTEVVGLCDRLPLAIRIAAARLRARPAWTPSHLADQLRNQRLGEPDVAAAFELSYRQLTDDQQRAFRLLGAHPGTDVDPYAAAALADTSLDVATRTLEDLVDAHLLQEPIPGRYRFHDLLRAYSASRETPEHERTAALDRLFDHYARTATMAMNVVYPDEASQGPRPPGTTTPTPGFDDPKHAETWLDTELRNLLAASNAARDARPDHTIHQSATLHHHLRVRGHYVAAATVHEQALLAARSTGDRIGELNALNGVGRIHRVQGRFEPASRAHQQALRLARATEHRAGELTALIGLGEVDSVRGRNVPATDALRQALDIARAVGDHARGIDALSALGRVYHVQGRYVQAADVFTEAHQMAEVSGYRGRQLHTLISLGVVRRVLGDYGRAVVALTQALTMARATGHRDAERRALNCLALVHYAQGRYELAAGEVERALELARAIGHRSSEVGALNNLGDIRRAQGRLDQATDTYRRARQLARSIGNRNYEFEAVHGLGRTHHTDGDHDQALALLQQALDIATELDQPPDQARAHDGLAATHHALGHHDQAREHWQTALRILDRIGVDHTDDPQVTADTIRGHLAGLDRRRTGLA